MYGSHPTLGMTWILFFIFLFFCIISVRLGMMEIKLRLSMLVVIETNAKSRKKVDSGGNPIFFLLIIII